jgi:tol-pal system protein YbgF
MTMMGSIAHAQESLDSLSDKVSRLQRELSDLQAQVYSGGSVGTAGSVSTPGVTAATQEVRLQMLETQMRDLTGKLEEMNFRINQVSDRLDKLVADVDFRLRALEGGNATPGQVGTVPPPGTGVAGAGGNTGVVGPLTPPPSGGQPGTLGTLSQSQIDANRVANCQQLADDAARAAGGQGAAAGQSGSAATLPEGTPQQQYDHAYELLRQGDYANAEIALKSFITKHPDDKLSGNAHYWLGETYYVRKDYTNAAKSFAEGLKKFPKGSKASDSLLKLGMSLSRLDRKADACKAFGELTKRYPDSAAAGKLPAEKKRAGCA